MSLLTSIIDANRECMRLSSISDTNDISASRFPSSLTMGIGVKYEQCSSLEMQKAYMDII